MKVISAGAGHDSHLRSVAKALTWRVLGTLATALIVVVFTGRWTLSRAVGAPDLCSRLACTGLMNG